MNLSRKVVIQLSVFLVITIIATSFMAFNYIKVQQMFFGIGQYKVIVNLQDSGGLYSTANVSYRGKEVGKVTSVTATEAGVRAELSIDSSEKIPSDLEAQVHSRSAVGEQYVDLIPRNTTSKALKDGSVIPVDRTSVPPNIGTLLDGISKTLKSVPQEQLQSTIDNAYLAFKDRGPDIRRLIESFSTLSGDARTNLQASLKLIDDAGPVLASQANTSGAIQEWARNLASATGQLRQSDARVRNVLANGPEAANQANALFQQLKPTVPVLLSNLVNVGKLAVTYNAALEQVIMLLPLGTASQGATAVPELGTGLNAGFLSFNLNTNLPQPCTTGYLPPSERRDPALVDTPPRPAGDFYCRIPQNAANAVRGLRNLPCFTEPGKRAPSVKLCKSDEQYVPLNSGRSPVGDPNSSASGQTVPQYSPAPAPKQVAVAQYDPSTGAYVGPDGKTYTQTDLVSRPSKEKTWQTMLMPSTQ